MAYGRTLFTILREILTGAARSEAKFAGSEAAALAKIEGGATKVGAPANLRSSNSSQAFDKGAGVREKELIYAHPKATTPPPLTEAQKLHSMGNPDAVKGIDKVLPDAAHPFRQRMENIAKGEVKPAVPPPLTEAQKLHSMGTPDAVKGIDKVFPNPAHPFRERMETLAKREALAKGEAKSAMPPPLPSAAADAAAPAGRSVFGRVAGTVGTALGMGVVAGGIYAAAKYYTGTAPAETAADKKEESKKEESKEVEFAPGTGHKTYVKNHGKIKESEFNKKVSIGDALLAAAQKAIAPGTTPEPLNEAGKYAAATLGPQRYAYLDVMGRFGVDTPIKDLKEILSNPAKREEFFKSLNTEDDPKRGENLKKAMEAIARAGKDQTNRDGSPNWERVGTMVSNTHSTDKLKPDSNPKDLVTASNDAVFANQPPAAEKPAPTPAETKPAVGADKPKAADKSTPPRTAPPAPGAVP